MGSTRTAAEEDAFEAWVPGVNCYTIERDLTELSDQARDAALSRRERRIAMYARYLLNKLDGDPHRLTSAARRCRDDHADAVNRGRDPASDSTDGFLRGAMLAEVALRMLSDARADTNLRAREKLLLRLRRQPGPSLRDRGREFASNLRVLRAGRRLRPSWWRRRALLDSVVFTHRVAGTPEGYSEIEAHRDGELVGRVVYQLCPSCRRGLLCKVNAYTPWDGLGLGTRLVDACVAAGPTTDGYTWTTTVQADDAVGFWRIMARRHATAFTSVLGACPHMR
ncbi:hypothetical protein R8Z50_22275 [Longispora sp. K20-0274]|uniref:hypothetical protein n=1 Tax=Longispora sp. K20-0274 TaxID=3088255 RepID=UPI00399B323D